MVRGFETSQIKFDKMKGKQALVRGVATQSMMDLSELSSVTTVEGPTEYASC